MPALPTLENAIRGLRPPVGRAQAVYRDEAVRGLGLRVGAKTKVWVVDLNRPGIAGGLLA